MKSSAVYADIAALIADGKPMALWLDPDGRLHKASASEPFIIVEAWAKYADRHVVGGKSLATTDTFTETPHTYEVEPHSTLRGDYIPAVNAVIDRLKERGGKSVISRTTCGSSDGIDWAAVAMRYFERYPATMRYLYFTPQTGYWLGASPELLYRGDGRSHIDRHLTMASFSICSLASAPWGIMPDTLPSLTSSALPRLSPVFRLTRRGATLTAPSYTRADATADT